MKVKTAKATNLQLDWGVGKVLQLEKLQLVEGGVVYKPSSGGRKVLRHTDPVVCMGLIEQHKIDITHERNCICASGQEWSADQALAYGKTLAEAVARCVIAMQLGDEFECPDELGVML